MQKKIVTNLFLLSIITSHALVAQDITNLQNRIDRIMNEGDMPSVSLSVNKNGKIIYKEGFGLANVESNLPTNPDMPYSIASITKPFTTIAIMMLAEEGKITLDEPINKYLGSDKLTAFVGSSDSATVRRVMHHTAGLPLYYDFYYEDVKRQRPGKSESIEQNGIIVYKPGETQQYSNFGYALLEYIIENVSGKSYSDFITERIFMPLGMKNSLIPTSPPQRDVARRYSSTNTEIPFYDFEHRGASAIYSSSTDLSKFGNFMINALDGKSDLISDNSVKELFDKKYDFYGNDDFYGLGIVSWTQNQNRVLYHSGGMPGVSCQLFIVPEKKLTVTALTNKTGVNSWAMVKELLREFEPRLYHSSISKKEIMENGLWEGTVRISDIQNKKIHLSVKNKDEVIVTLNGKKTNAIQIKELKDDFIEVELKEGIFPTSENHGIKLKLKKRKNLIYNGYLTVLGQSNGTNGGFAKSFWIELHKK